MRPLVLFTLSMFVSGGAIVIATVATDGHPPWLMALALCWIALAPVVIYLLRKDELDGQRQNLGRLALQGASDA